ncbi:uncharacterized protein LOC114524053 [Dendronephthya gigantea]|uniref:uncharacterized protein LOC114524053 n=1 Tax=Dendronephthya gigantea TaxID=151771 RepID=UPI00106C4B20|nr:uncharacterized protein LOC114524053 [Dendronephthya gigantea]
MGSMFSLLYCFIGSFFIFTCALASNETRNGNRSSINDCIHLTDMAQISRLGEIFESKLVNIVDLHFSVDSDFNETMFHRMQLTLVNMVGLKITLLLDSYLFSYSKDFTSTLNAGRRSFELHANISHEGCVGRNLSSLDFVDSLLQQLQEKYFALKKMIYEECRDNAYKEKHLETIRRQKGRNTKLVPVVSRKLYHKIRERLLPYYKSFFYYSFTVVTLIIPLSTILYGELETVREIDVTPTNSLLISLMIGVLPYAYNSIIQARNGEDWRAAWKEEIKMNVKCMVQDNPDLAKTILVIRPDGTADDDADDEQPEQEMVQDRTLYETSV